MHCNEHVSAGSEDIRGRRLYFELLAPDVEPVGNAIAYRLDVGGKKFEVQAPTTDVFAAGADVFVAVHPKRCILLLE